MAILFTQSLLIDTFARTESNSIDFDLRIDSVMRIWYVLFFL